MKFLTMSSLALLTLTNIAHADGLKCIGNNLDILSTGQKSSAEVKVTAVGSDSVNGCPLNITANTSLGLVFTLSQASGGTCEYLNLGMVDNRIDAAQVGGNLSASVFIDCSTAP